ncbi:MAG: hypothetical protein LBE31_04295 [Deltaproteobacteria bacterium]|jgi:hypothetical protein|nr:hypothetical protein [Deltaproteobacteria bacterium]
MQIEEYIYYHPEYKKNFTAYRFFNIDVIKGKTIKTIELQLGAEFDFDRRFWPNLANRIQTILTGQNLLFLPAPNIEAKAQEIARQIRDARLFVASGLPLPEPTFTYVEPKKKEKNKNKDKLMDKDKEKLKDQPIKPKKVGVAYVTLNAIKQLGLQDYLAKKFNKNVYAAAMALIGARLEYFTSWSATTQWLGSDSALGDLLGHAFPPKGQTRLESAAESLWCHRKDILNLLNQDGSLETRNYITLFNPTLATPLIDINDLEEPGWVDIWTKIGPDGRILALDTGWLPSRTDPFKESKLDIDKNSILISLANNKNTIIMDKTGLPVISFWGEVVAKDGPMKFPLNTEEFYGHRHDNHIELLKISPSKKPSFIFIWHYMAHEQQVTEDELYKAAFAVERSFALYSKVAIKSRTRFYGHGYHGRALLGVIASRCLEHILTKTSQAGLSLTWPELVNILSYHYLTPAKPKKSWSVAAAPKKPKVSRCPACEPIYKAMGLAKVPKPLT